MDNASKFRELIHEFTGIPISKLQSFKGVFQQTNALKITNIQKNKLHKLKQLFALYNEYVLCEEVAEITSSDLAGEYLAKIEKDNTEVEVFKMILLDTQNKVIKLHTLSIGTITEVVVYPREVAKIVLEYNAKSVILTHNHPGGDMKASCQDLEVNRRIKQTLDAIEVKLLDHIITMPNGRYYSMAEGGEL